MGTVVVVAVIIGIFFVGGLLVGVAVMAALAARKTSSRPRRTWPQPQTRADFSPDPADLEPDDDRPDDDRLDDDRLDEPSRWPGHYGG